MNSVSPAVLRIWIKDGKEFQLIDVREEWEHRAYNIGGQLVPVSRLMTGLDLFREDIPLVIYCEKGIRSAIAIQRLQRLGYSNLYNLEGGMEAWKATVPAAN